VSTYKIRLKQKLQAGSLLEMIDIARRHGLLDGPLAPQPAPAEPLDAAQHQELERLRRMLDALPYTVAVRDTQGRLIACNRPHLQQFKVRLEDVIGKCLHESGELPMENASLIHARLMEDMARGEPHSRDVVINVHGEQKVFRHWGQPYRDAQGNLLGMICGNVELTDRERVLLDLRTANERAEAASREMSAILSAIGDELGSSLQSLVAMLDLTLAGEPQMPRQEPVQVARATAQGLLAVVADLQQLNALEAGKHLLAPEPLELTELLAEQLARHREQAEGRGLELRADFSAARHPRVWADRRCLSRLLDGLLSNAFTHSQQGTIHMRVGANGRGQGLVEVTLEVEDNGVDIAAEAPPRLLEPFASTLDQGIRRAGNGIGLALCKRLVDQMNGRIELHSRQGGTRAVVTLLLTSADQSVKNGAP
jgi:PAS domain S-box-containing protein